MYTKGGRKELHPKDNRQKLRHLGICDAMSKLEQDICSYGNTSVLRLLSLSNIRDRVAVRMDLLQKKKTSQQANP
jgi:hypothetical protein